MIKISIAKRILAFIMIILIFLSIMFFIGPYQFLVSKIYDDDDQGSSNLRISNSTGKGFYNSELEEQVHIFIEPDKAYSNLKLHVSIENNNDELTLYFLTKTDYETWNGTPALKVANLSMYSFYSIIISPNYDNIIEFYPSSTSGVNTQLFDFYIVFTNTSTLSTTPYDLKNVDVTLHYSLFGRYDFIYGILLIIITLSIVIVPFSLKRVINKRREKSEKISRKKELTTTAPPPKNMVELKRQYEFYGGFIRVKLKIENNINFVISDVKFMFEIPQSLKLMSIEPRYEMEGDTIKLQTIPPSTGKTISFILEPLICGDEIIRGSIRYLDNTGKQQFLSMDDLKIKITCPLFFTDESANIARLKNLKEKKLDKQDERSYLIPEGLEFEKTLVILKEVIGKHDVKLVFEDVKAQPTFNANLWYFGRTKVKKREFVIEGVVSEQKNSIKIVVSCSDTDQLVGLLAELGANLREKILQTGFIKNESELKALRCPACAGPLDHYPKPGETVRCPWCEFLIVNE
ncbi:MAG: hypothetical protein ACTSVY_07345 [Candidatus Helarchaeota archaeon]